MRSGAEGQKAEAAYAKDKTLPDPSSTDNPEFKIVLSIIKAGLEKHPQKYTNMAKALKGTPAPLSCCLQAGCSSLLPHTTHLSILPSWPSKASKAALSDCGHVSCCSRAPTCKQACHPSVQACRAHQALVLLQASLRRPPQA